MSHTQPSSETPLSPMSQQPNLTHEKETSESLLRGHPILIKMENQMMRLREPSDDTPALDSQIFTPNLTKEIVIESPLPTQVSKRNTEMNETPSSPISPKSIEAQTVTEGTYEATQPLTEIISANNKKRIHMLCITHLPLHCLH
ncbi:hypothetical protein Bca52824_086989 [Brassica carinata]|uniref:Uncharacterized protein n=1 Tax=Brassica carinata TaxID=52824 RepID=A0A8X7P8U9_BRACI|nr:hypothetical protein Bca52824_086989 [Brassica carinata]